MAAPELLINVPAALTVDILRHILSYIPLFPRLRVVARVCKAWHALVINSISAFDKMVPTEAFLLRHQSRLTSLTTLRLIPFRLLRDLAAVPGLSRLTKLTIGEASVPPASEPWPLPLPSLASLKLSWGNIPHLAALAATATALTELTICLASSQLAAFRGVAVRLTRLVCADAKAIDAIASQGTVYPKLRRLEFRDGCYGFVSLVTVVFHVLTHTVVLLSSSVCCPSFPPSQSFTTTAILTTARMNFGQSFHHS